MDYVVRMTFFHEGQNFGNSCHVLKLSTRPCPQQHQRESRCVAAESADNIWIPVWLILLLGGTEPPTSNLRLRWCRDGIPKKDGQKIKVSGGCNPSISRYSDSEGGDIFCFNFRQRRIFHPLSRATIRWSSVDIVYKAYKILPSIFPYQMNLLYHWPVTTSQVKNFHQKRVAIYPNNPISTAYNSPRKNRHRRRCWCLIGINNAEWAVEVEETKGFNEHAR